VLTDSPETLIATRFRSADCTRSQMVAADLQSVGGENARQMEAFGRSFAWYQHPLISQRTFSVSGLRITVFTMLGVRPSESIAPLRVVRTCEMARSS
jgi:hypothetical protein